MAELPVELRSSFLPWEETEEEAGMRGFRTWVPGTLGPTDPEKSGWVTLTCAESLTGEVFGTIPGWFNVNSWHSLNRALRTVHEIAKAREWNELWALAQEAQR